MKRLSGILFAAGVLLALVVVAAACDGGGGGSDRDAGEYFDEIMKIASRHEVELEAAWDTYDAVGTAEPGEEKEVEAYRDLLGALSKSIRAEIADREKVDPPPEIEEAHLDLLAAARVMAKIYEEALEGSSDVKTASELQQALHAVKFSDRLLVAQNSAEQACTKLQALADKEGIESKVC